MEWILNNRITILFTFYVGLDIVSKSYYCSVNIEELAEEMINTDVKCKSHQRCLTKILISRH